MQIKFVKCFISFCTQPFYLNVSYIKTYINKHKITTFTCLIGREIWSLTPSKKQNIEGLWEYSAEETILT
jgi:hypothetical protein